VHISGGKSQEKEARVKETQPSALTARTLVFQFGLLFLHLSHLLPYTLRCVLDS
jgi:hypothetical protein